MNSRWIRYGRGPGAAALAVLLATACTGGRSAGGRSPEAEAAAQAEAEELGREVADIVDRIMAYKSAHQGKLPASIHQAGIDSLVSQYIRRLGRSGADPLVTIVYRRTEGRELIGCSGTNEVLEDKLLRAGAFDVNCTLTDGTTRDFTVPPPAPPKSKE